jgi:DNA uptake protein ComE-like DNA-binding protein
LREIFRFSKSERIASLIILVLTLLVVVGLVFVRRIRPLPGEEAKLFDSLVITLLPGEELLSQAKEKEDTPAVNPAPSGMDLENPPPVRDPNRMTRSEWEQLPLPPYVIRTLLNYRKKGGVFRKKEDLKKIYGMTDSLYEAIAPFLRVEGQEQEPAEAVSLPPAEKRKMPERALSGPVAVDINRADSAVFDSLPGISPWLARRIVRYRALLGGFVRKEQLLEVYGLDSLTYHKIRDRLTQDTALIRRINVNSCDEHALAHHPYLSRQEAGAVIFYREHFGKIDELEVLLKQHVLPEKTFRRIRPYLKTREEK